MKAFPRIAVAFVAGVVAAIVGAIVVGLGFFSTTPNGRGPNSAPADSKVAASASKAVVDAPIGTKGRPNLPADSTGAALNDGTSPIRASKAVVDAPIQTQARPGPSDAAELVRHWTVGSTKATVKELQGTPKSINKYPALGYEKWGYNSGDTVTFDIQTDSVTEWDNPSGKLHVAMDMNGRIAIAEPKAVFTVGSTKKDVLRAEGTPKSINKYPALGYEKWGYNSGDTVTFDIQTDSVTEWDNPSGKLHITDRGL